MATSPLLIQLLGCVGVLVTAYYIVRKWQSQASIQSIKRRYTCAEPTRYPQKDPWGSDLVKERATAIQQGRWLRLYWDQHDRLGRTFVETVRGETTINTMDPENFKHVFVTQYSSFGKPSIHRRWTLPLLGNSILNDGPHHKMVKALIRPVFSRAENLSDTLEPFADKFIELLPATGVQFDAFPLCQRLFLDFSTDFIFGAPIDALNDAEKGDKFLAAFTTALRYIGKKRDAGWLAFKYSWSKENVEACQTIHQFVDAQVARALRETKKDKGDKYIILDEMAKQIRDPLELRSQIMGIFVPAKDTPAVALSNCLFELARQPHRWSQLRWIALTADEPLSFRQLRSPEFEELRFVVFETLRHIGPGAMLQRFAKEDCILPRGGGPEQDQPIFVAKDTKIYLNTSAWHRDPGVWGQDFDQFRPERWRDRTIGEWEWLPFITGHRRCPAADLTLIHTTYMLVRLLQKYTGIKNHDPEEKYIEQWDMTHRSRNGAEISFE